MLRREAGRHLGRPAGPPPTGPVLWAVGGTAGHTRLRLPPSAPTALNNRA